MEDGLRRRTSRSFSQVPEDLICDLRVSDRGVRLWALLDRCCKGTTVSMPTRQMLAAALDCSLRSLDYAMTSLLDNGWIARQSGRMEGRPSIYELIEDTPPGCAISCAPLRNMLQLSLQNIAALKPVNQGKRDTESKRENPPTPNANALGEPCPRHKRLGRPHHRCRDCGTAGRPPKAAPPSPPPYAQVAGECSHRSAPAHCAECRKEAS